MRASVSNFKRELRSLVASTCASKRLFKRAPCAACFSATDACFSANVACLSAYSLNHKGASPLRDRLEDVEAEEAEEDAEVVEVDEALVKGGDVEVAVVEVVASAYTTSTSIGK